MEYRENKTAMKKRYINKLLINLSISLLFVFISLPGLALETKDVNQAIRDKGARWVAGETSVSKLSPEDIRRRFMPIKFTNAGLLAKSSRFSAKFNNRPAKFDWRNVNGHSYVTSIKDQGKCSSCWAFAATAALESRILITSHTPDTDLYLSEQSQVSCDESSSGCKGGYLDRALSYLQTNGIPLETCFPYTSGESGETGVCGGCADWRQNTYRITSFEDISTEDISTSVEAIKNAIVQYGPLVAGMIIYEDFLHYKSGVYSSVTDIIVASHAVTIVGYDDAEQAWIVKNSIGPDWGEDGYFRIRAGTNECNIEQEVYAVHFAVVPGASFVLSPTSADFGTLVLPDQAAQTLPFTITNNGSVPLINISSMVTNPQYSITPLTVSTLESAASTDIQVTYTAHAGKTADTAELQVASAEVSRKSQLTAQTNTRPDQPVNLSPADGAIAGRPITLTASAFVDADDDAHASSQWIIQNTSGSVVYSGSFDADNKTSFTVPAGTLQENAEYYWQVIYRDDRGVASFASVRTSFIIIITEPGKGGCFIATAAFGSPMAGQVEILRQFRDRHLLTNNLGRKFVAWYYRNGPDAANRIEDKPLIKAAIRVALYPLIGFSFLLVSGYLPFVIVGLLLAAFLFLRLRPKNEPAGRHA